MLMNVSSNAEKRRPVKNKADFVERYSRGEFGNRSPTWNSLEEWVEDESLPPMKMDCNLYNLRNRMPGGVTRYNLSAAALMTAPAEYYEPNWYVSAMAPSDKTLIQGEVKRSTNFLEFRYTLVPKPMREALAQCESRITGMSAKMLLKEFLDSNSYDWLNFLLDAYEDHIVEFSTFSICWGTLPGYNTVFWEVRPDRPFGSNLSPFTQVY